MISMAPGFHVASIIKISGAVIGNSNTFQRLATLTGKSGSWSKSRSSPLATFYIYIEYDRCLSPSIFLGALVLSKNLKQSFEFYKIIKIPNLVGSNA